MDMDMDEMGIGPQKGDKVRKKSQSTITAEIAFVDAKFVHLTMDEDRRILPVDLDSFSQQWEPIPSKEKKSHE